MNANIETLQSESPRQVFSDRQIRSMKAQYSKPLNAGHAALLDIILKAKNDGNHFADQALHELENLTGRTFGFVHMIAPNFARFELVSTS